jgi:hypothetical protein
MTNPTNPTKLYWVGIPEGSIIEWYAPKHVNGINTNDPVVRHVGRVSMVKPAYLLVQPANGFDASSRVRLYEGTEVTVLAEQAEAGWANLYTEAR